MIGHEGFRLEARWPVRAILGGFLAAVALSWAPGPAAGAPTITGIEVSPTHFSPDGDGFRDQTQLRFTPGGAADSVMVDVSVSRVSDGAPIDTLIAGEIRASSVEVARDWVPGTLADGRYRFDVRVTEGPDSVSASAEVVADSTPPAVAMGPLSENPFDPAVAALSVDVRVSADTTTTTSVWVLQGGVGIDSLGIVAGVDTVRFSWGGLVFGGAQAASGTYEIRAMAQDLAANVDSVFQSVTLDRDPPSLVFDQPDTVQTVAFPVTLSGRALDDDRVSTVEVSLDGGQSFVPADSVSAPADTVLWQVFVEDPSPVPGYRDATLRAVDAYGHATESTRVIAYDTVLPAHVSSSLVGATTVADGDSVEILTTWDPPGLAVTADFSDLDSGYSPGGETVTDQGGGSYRIRYRVSPTNSRLARSRDVVITASTGVLASSDTLSVTLVDRHGGALVSVDRNRFDPREGELVTIASGSATAGVTVEVFDLSGRRVRLLEGSGFVEWDGRNERGAVAASGVYFLKVEVGGAEEVRKVALLRGGSR